MERELISEDDPPLTTSVAMEFGEYAEVERLEQLLRGIVHTLLATYRIADSRIGRHARRRRRRGRLLEAGCISAQT